MRAMDSKTGKLFESDSKLYSLARRKRPANPPPNPPGLPGDWQAVEAPFIVHHGKYYYLLVSFDLCCRGTKSNYKTIVGRSRNVTGPYVDSDGTPMMDGGGTPVLLGNSRWIGPGGESVGHEKDADIMVFHAYDGGRTRRLKVAIRRIIDIHLAGFCVSILAGSNLNTVLWR